MTLKTYKLENVPFLLKIQFPAWPKDQLLDRWWPCRDYLSLSL